FRVHPTGSPRVEYGHGRTANGIESSFAGQLLCVSCRAPLLREVRRPASACSTGAEHGGCGRNSTMVVRHGKRHRHRGEPRREVDRSFFDEVSERQGSRDLRTHHDGAKTRLPVFSPDSATMLASDETGAIQEVSVRDGATKRKIRGATNAITSSPTFSP